MRHLVLLSPLALACGSAPSSPGPDAATQLEQANAAAQAAVGATYELVHVPAGTYQIGNPNPHDDATRRDEAVHPVVLTYAYEIGKNEVTHELWEEVMGAPTRQKGKGCQEENCAVGAVNWFDAVRFANTMSGREGRPPCYEIDGENVTWPQGLACTGYRLPTEAEWEIAARAGEDFKYSGSDDAEAVGWVGQYVEGASKAIATKAPNAWGIHDMTGGKGEWCWDWFAPYPSASVTDPTGPAERYQDRGRIFRGGYHRDVGKWPVYARMTSAPQNDYLWAGVRLVRTAE